MVPQNLYERWFSLFVLLCGLGMFSSFLSSISSLMTHLRNLNAEKHNENQSVRRYIMQHDLSIELGSAITRFLKQNRRTSGRRRLIERDVNAFKLLPEGLHMKLHWEVFEPAVLAHPLFHSLNNIDHTGLVEICHRSIEEIQIMAGHELFYYGQQATHMYFVSSGSLEFFPSRIGSQPIELSTKQWACEMVMWMSWIHRGTMVSGSAHTELFVLSATAFHSNITHREAAFEQCRRYAKMYITKILSLNDGADNDCDEGYHMATDVWGTIDDIQEIV